MSGAGKKGKKYPHIWMSGADEVDHKLYTDCLRAKAQANYRGEEWLIKPLEFIALWRQSDRYMRKGRGRDDLTMTRIDPEKSWNISNVKFLTRREFLQELYLGRPKKQYKRKLGGK